MFGGLTNGHSGYPAFQEENRSQYDMSALPQLQLFGKFPGSCTFDNMNFVGNGALICAVERDTLDKVKEEDVMDRFQAMKNRRGEIY